MRSFNALSVLHNNYTLPDFEYFVCNLLGHFWFNVINSIEELLYSGCYDAENKGQHIIEYILTRERLEMPSVRWPSARFTQNRDSGVLLELLRENGFLCQTMMILPDQALTRDTWLQMLIFTVQKKTPF